MDTKSQAHLDGIVRKEPAALTQADIVFLRARQSYLTAEQRERYAEVLNDKPSRPSKKKDEE